MSVPLIITAIIFIIFGTFAAALFIAKLIVIGRQPNCQTFKK